MSSGRGRIASIVGRACGLLFAASATLAGPAEPQASDVILKALKEELARSMSLKVETLEKPYFMAYVLTDIVTFDAEASLGALVTAPETSRYRWFKPEVRVGSYALDNSEFFGERSFFGSRFEFGHQIVIEDDSATLRHEIWLATDEAFKGALEQYAEKRAALKNRVEGEGAADFSPEVPTVSLPPAPMPEIEPVRWREMIRRLSAIFREYPGIQESSVKLRVALGKRYFVNSEGTAIRRPAWLVLLSARAAAQAPDGMPVKHFLGLYTKSLDRLPAEKELATAVRAVAEELKRVSSSSALESYSGPVLFSGQAAAELFLQLLVPQLSGHRPPVFERQEMEAILPKSDLANRLNRPVLPSFLSVVDDPTQESFRGLPLFGAYTFDDQGVRAAPLTLIENGILKTLLMSRRPRKEIAKSNGHGRSLSQGSAGGVIGNLFVRTEPGQAIADAKKELIRLCRQQGLKWGLWIRVLDQPGLSGGGFFNPFRMGASAFGPFLTLPLIAYKVSAEDGREELVRGLLPGEISLRNLKDIAAAGEDYYVHNRAFLAGGGLMGMMGMGGFRGSDDGAGGIPVTVIAPSVLFGELEFKSEPGSRQKPPLLASPLAAKAATR